MDHKFFLLPSLPVVALRAMAGFICFIIVSLISQTEEIQAIDLKKPLFEKLYGTYHGTNYEDTLNHTFETATNRKNYWVLPACQGFGFVQPITDPFWYQAHYCRDFRKVTQNDYGTRSTTLMRFCQNKEGKWQQCYSSSCTDFPASAQEKCCYNNKTRQ